VRRNIDWEDRERKAVSWNLPTAVDLLHKASVFPLQLLFQVFLVKERTQGNEKLPFAV